MSPESSDQLALDIAGRTLDFSRALEHDSYSPDLALGLLDEIKTQLVTAEDQGLVSAEERCQTLLGLVEHGKQRAMAERDGHRAGLFEAIGRHVLGKLAEPFEPEAF